MTEGSRRGRPLVGDRPLTVAERKARSRQNRATVQLAVDVPAEVASALYTYAELHQLTIREALCRLIVSHCDTAKAARL